MSKYAQLRQSVQGHPLLSSCPLIIPHPASPEQLTRVHSRDYVSRVFSGALSQSEQRRIGFPWSPYMVERSRRSVGGTIAALRSAIGQADAPNAPNAWGAAVNLAGGTHHAARDHGAGYCVFNDAVVAARCAQDDGLAKRVLIVDLDVHQGDGTASLCAQDPSIYTFSIHAARNYPARKPASDLDIALDDDCDDTVYLDTLQQALPQVIHTAGADAAIYLAGADPFVDDRLGRLSLTKAGLEQRDQLVFEALAAAGLPVAVTMAGGYAHRVEDIVEIHLATVVAAFSRWQATGC